MQFRPAKAERIADVLIRTCTVSVKRYGEALNANSCHGLPPVGRLPHFRRKMVQIVVNNSGGGNVRIRARTSPSAPGREETAQISK